VLRNQEFKLLDSNSLRLREERKGGSRCSRPGEPFFSKALRLMEMRSHVQRLTIIFQQRTHLRCCLLTGAAPSAACCC
jgi:hypothetical protein